MTDDKIYFDDNETLHITYPNYGDEGRNFGDLFDWLGDFDIVTASELEHGYIVHDGNIYMFDNQEEINLMQNSNVILEVIDTLENYINTEFYKWYYK